ncbi:MAG: hypothetical protein ACQEXJ_10130 [Myxococcota bacterium]
MAVMIGGISAHATRLGLEVQGDGGRRVMMLVLALASPTRILLFRRRELPFVGSTL